MLVFQANTAEEFRQAVVQYLEGQLAIEENAVCSRASKRERLDHESRRNLLLSLSDNLKEAVLKRIEDV
jgi:hypothetical protein